MKQKDLSRIGQVIKHHRELEANISATNEAFAKFEVSYEGRERKIWLLNNPFLGNFKITHDFHNRADGVIAGRRNVVENDGLVIHRNSDFGTKLIEDMQGTIFIHRPDGGQTKLNIKTKAYYTPVSKKDARDIRIMDGGQFDESFTFNSLVDLLEIRGEVFDEPGTDQIANLDIAFQEDKKQDEITPTNLEEPKKRSLPRFKPSRRSFIRTQMGMRYQPILEGYQNEIKRTDPYGIPLVITGGPGSGKTTTLIQRTKFLIDEVAFDEYAPSDFKKESYKTKVLAKGSWVFFSPNRTLLKYLTSAMRKENLEVNDNNSKVWDEEKWEMSRVYRLTRKIKPETLKSLNTMSYLLTTDILALDDLEKELDRTILLGINETLNKLNYSVGHDSTDQLINRVRDYLRKGKIYEDIDIFIRDILSAKRVYNKELIGIKKEYEILLTDKLKTILEDLSRDSVRLAILFDRVSTPDKVFESVESDTEDDLIEKENIDKVESDFFTGMDSTFLKKFKVIAERRIRFLSGFDKKATIKDHSTFKLFPELDILLEDTVLLSMNRGIRILDKVLSGVSKALLEKIKPSYLNVRKTLLGEENLYFKQETWNKMGEGGLENDLHPNEIAFLVAYINQNVHKIITRVKAMNTTLPRHTYIQAYLKFSRPIISVDEVTVYHPVDLKAIYSLRDLEISSVTLSGDLMQNTSEHGVSEWDLLELIMQKVQIKELNISYRQTATLIELANAIYNKETGQVSSFKSQFNKMQEEPWPILYINEDDNSTFDWIADRIQDILTSYDKIKTTIAVFVNQTEEVEVMTRELRLRFLNKNLKISNSQEGYNEDLDLGVFAIDEIQGLEFEAVIFHRYDEMASIYSPKLMARKLYVALTRATFYLAITASDDLPDELEYLYEPLVGHRRGVDWKELIHS